MKHSGVEVECAVYRFSGIECSHLYEAGEIERQWVLSHKLYEPATSENMGFALPEPHAEWGFDVPETCLLFVHRAVHGVGPVERPQHTNDLEVCSQWELVGISVHKVLPFDAVHIPPVQ